MLARCRSIWKFTGTRLEIEDSFNAIRRFAEHVPQYQVDANRLKCEQALMCYGSAVRKIAEFICAVGAQEKAKWLFLNAINTMADWLIRRRN